jgi:hypothetical protein
MDHGNDRVWPRESRQALLHKQISIITINRNLFPVPLDVYLVNFSWAARLNIALSDKISVHEDSNKKS